MEGEENDVGLSDIIDVLNTLDNPPNGEQYNASANLQQLPKKVPQELASPSSSTTSSSSSKKPKPYIKIVEQPAPKALRFRYKCEGRSAGSIPGINSTPENKTFPTIEIVGHTGGDVIIVVSCVTKDAPYRPHPHNIVGKDEKSCSNGICTLTISGNPARAVFSNLGIQCVKKKDIKAALDVRENLKVDPFKTKFAHKDQPSSIDLNAVRLCFQAYHRTPDGVKSLAKAVVTEPIYDKKGIYELTICRLCSCSAKVGGGDEIILLCEKFSKDDIKIRFFELNAEGNVIWEDFGEFQATDIHKQNAIAFKTPRYHNVEISEKAKVFIQLVRPSDQECSEPLPFEFHPDTDHFRRKRLRTAGSPKAIYELAKLKHEETQQQNSHAPNDFRVAVPANCAGPSNGFYIGGVKAESISPNYASHRSPFPVASPSPQPPSPCNRLDTPSPGLMKTLSAESQKKMCDMFAFSAGVQQQQQQQSQQQQMPQQQQQQGQQQFASTNPFVANITISNAVNVDNNFNHLFERQQSNGINGINNNTNTNGFINHQTLAPRISGGSITPIWDTPNVVQNGFQQINYVVSTQAQQMPPQQQQQMQQGQQIQQQHQLNQQQQQFNQAQLLKQQLSPQPQQLSPQPQQLSPQPQQLSQQLSPQQLSPQQLSPQPLSPQQQQPQMQISAQAISQLHQLLPQQQQQEFAQLISQQQIVQQQMSPLHQQQPQYQIHFVPVEQQQQQQQQHEQQQQQQLQQLPNQNDCDMATEECPTLSGLLRYIENDDLALSNLSISS